MKIKAPFVVTAVGDIIEPQPLYSDDPGFQKLVERIRQADIGFGNMESSLVDFRTFQGPVAGTEAPLETGEAIKAMGITLMSRANNHAFDRRPCSRTRHCSETARRENSTLRRSAWTP
jgi:poly-gamma-glutamate synthesis protein (capsule biosynthesis protein)